jgi:hypothetical protein
MDKFTPLMEAAQQAELRSRLLSTTNGTPFTYQYFTAQEVKKIAKRSADSSLPDQQNDFPPGKSSASSVLSKNVGILVTVPAFVLLTTGYPDIALIYIGALAGGVALNQRGIWSAASILLANNAAFIAYVGSLYTLHKDEEFSTEWLSHDYKSMATEAKALFNDMKGTDTALIPTTIWGVISAKLTFITLPATLSFASLAKAASSYFATNAYKAAGAAAAQSIFNIIFESATGSPLGDWIPAFYYDDNYSRANPRNWPYYMKHAVTNNILLLGWAAKHLTKGTTFMWKQKKVE